MKQSSQNIVYERIMEHEEALSPYHWDLASLNAETIMNDLGYITEFIALSTKPRSYNHERYGKASIKVAPESIASHTLLVLLIVQKALDNIYGPESKYTIDGYTREVVREAVLRHDLPENTIGDIPDNGTRNDVELGKTEREYWKNFSDYGNDKNFEKKVNRLLKEMQSKSSYTGCLIYVADKAAAILRVLYEDQINEPAEMSLDYEDATDRDRYAMTLCDNKSNGKCRASEMWTISYFKSAKSVNYDEYGYVTALIIMMTLQTHNRWYSWKAEDYLM